MSFDDFAGDAGPRLRAALVASYGPDIGLEAAADAMAYGFEHWPRLSSMNNPAGYLYRVGQTSARRSRRVGPLMPVPDPTTTPRVEPGLVPALNELSEMQRTCVLLVHAFEWTRAEAAALLEIDESSVRTHIRRGMDKLQTALEVNFDVI